MGIAPLFEKYLKIFQSEEPLVHILYPEMKNVLIVLMKRLIKPALLKDKTVSELVKINFDKEENQLKLMKIDYRKEAENYLSNIADARKNDARKSMRDSYVKIINYLQKTLPLNSKMLQDITCLSPLLRSCDWSVDAIGRLAELIPHLISEREVSIVNDEWRLYQSEEIDEIWIKDPETGKFRRLDFYWSNVFKVLSSSGDKKYLFLSKVVKSFLSIPNGNAGVERSLSDNKNTLTTERVKLKEETLTALRRAKEFARDIGGAHNVDTRQKGMLRFLC